MSRKEHKSFDRSISETNTQLRTFFRRRAENYTVHKKLKTFS